jgi:ankyrin repeat protein
VAAALAVLTVSPGCAKVIAGRNGSLLLQLIRNLRNKCAGKCLQEMVDMTRAIVLAYPDAAKIYHDNDGLPIHLAFAYRAPVEICHLLHEANPQGLLLSADPRGAFCIHLACKNPSVRGYYVSGATASDINCVKMCLDIDVAQAKMCDKDGIIPLHLCVANAQNYQSGANRHGLDRQTECSNCIKALLTAFPDAIQQRDAKNGWLPLHFAIEKGTQSINLKTILDAYPGAASEEFVVGGVSSIPLGAAIRAKRPPEILQYLCDVYNSAVSRVDGSGRLPLHLAMLHRVWSKEIIDLLLFGGPEVVTASVLSERQGRSTVQRAGALALQQRDNDGCLPLHVALDNLDTSPAGPHWDCVLMLLDIYPEAISVPNHQGIYPVHFAIRRKCAFEIITKLLDRFKPPIDSLFKQGNRNLLHWILHANISSRKYTAANVSTIIEMEGPSALEATDSTGMLPLHIAAAPTYTSRLSDADASDIFTTVLEASPSTAIKALDGQNRLPLHYAACGSLVGAVRYMVESNGCESLAHKDDQGCMPIHLAAKSGSVAVVEAIMCGMEKMYASPLKTPKATEGEGARLEEGLRQHLAEKNSSGSVPLWIAQLREDSIGDAIMKLLKPHSPALTLEGPWEIRSQLVRRLLSADENQRDFDNEDECYLEIDRDDYLRSAIDRVMTMDEDELHTTPTISFENEEGSDYGGLSRDFFREFAEKMAGEAELFKVNAAGAIQPVADVICEAAVPDAVARSRTYTGCGRICGLALHHGYLLGTLCTLARALSPLTAIYGTFYGRMLPINDSGFCVIRYATVECVLTVVAMPTADHIRRPAARTKRRELRKFGLPWLERSVNS